MIDSKVLRFALLGACGCLAAWVAGEGWLAATIPAAGSVGPSIVGEQGKLAPPSGNVPPPPVTPKGVPVPPPPVPPSPEMAKRLEAANAGTGDVQITLQWENRNDLDLHCIDPSGFEISFEKKKSPSKGWLDVDRNVSPKDDAPIENIFWAKDSAPIGRYQIFVVYFNNHAGIPRRTPFVLRTLFDGKALTFSGNEFVLDKAKEKREIVGTFEIKRILSLGLPDEVIVNQGGKNTLPLEVVRKRLSGPVSFTFASGGKGLHLTSTTIESAGTRGAVEVTADANAEPGRREVTVIAKCGEVEERGRVVVEVRGVPPALQLSAPVNAEVFAGGTNRLTLEVRRERFSGPIELTMAGDAKGLTIDPATIPEGVDKIEVTLRAAADLKEGERTLKIEAAGAARGEAKAAAEVKLNVRLVPKAGWSWFDVMRIACWTGLLAAGLATALACGQNYYLERPLIAPGLALIVAGSFAAGAGAGGLGQSLLAGLASTTLEPMIGFVIGWLVLGALVGRGVGFFIPNLSGSKAGLAGAIGGLAGGVSFLAVSRIGGDLPGRLIGSVLLGASIGAMVAIAERVFRKVWLEVRRGPNEAITVNLGPEPVKIGAAPGCTVFVAGAQSVLRYWVREGKVVCEPSNEPAAAEPTGRARVFGSVTLTVHSANQTSVTPAPARPASASPGALPTPGALPIPGKLPPAAAPTRHRDPDGCPKCGNKAPGPKGLRFCPDCECKF